MATPSFFLSMCFKEFRTSRSVHSGIPCLNLSLLTFLRMLNFFSTKKAISHALAIGFEVIKLLGEQMSSFAMCLIGMYCRRTITSQDICSKGNFLHVKRITARAIPTKVVKLWDMLALPPWKFTEYPYVINTMGRFTTTPPLNSPISTFVNIPHVIPASRQGSNGDFGHQSLSLNWCGVYNQIISIVHGYHYTTNEPDTHGHARRPPAESDWRESDEIPYWGVTGGRFDEFIKELTR